MHPAVATPRTYLRGIASLLALAAVFALLQFALPGVSPHPVRPDDYANVGSELTDMGLQWKRPVSANLIFFVAGFGVWASYLFLWTLAVLDAALVLLLVLRVFAVRASMASIFAFAIIVFSHVSAFEHATYLGLLTNLISHLFGLATLFALWRGWRDGHARWWLVAASTYLLAALAKEDFLLPPLLLIAWLATESWRDRAPSAAPIVRRTRALGAIALLAVGSGSLLWNAHAHNPFVAGLFSPGRSSAAYAVDLSPGTFTHALWTLLAGFAPAACATAVLVCVALCWQRPTARLRVLWLVATVVSLALPYALISNNMPPFRAYAWLPWMAAITVIAIQCLGERGDPVSARSDADTRAHRAAPVAGLASVAVALAIAWAQHAPRAAIIVGYAHDAAINRRIVDTLRRDRAAIGRAPAVGLIGLGETSPWCAQDAAYVNGKLGFRNHWIVFVPAPTGCYTQQAPDARRKQGIHVSVVDRAALCGYGALPVIEYAPDGSGRLRHAAEFCEATRR